MDEVIVPLRVAEALETSTRLVIDLATNIDLEGFKTTDGHHARRGTRGRAHPTRNSHPSIEGGVEIRSD